MSSRKSRFVPALVLGAVGAASSSCSSASVPDEGASAPYCDIAAATRDPNVDANVRMVATVAGEFKTTAKAARASVLTACANMARDLGGVDTWSALGDGDAAIANSDKTGACNVAAVCVRRIVDAFPSANLALVITKGACHPDFAAQARCDVMCNGGSACDSESAESRCESAELTCKCDAICKNESACRGTVARHANCAGECAGTCHGECFGTCTGANGALTKKDEDCHGKCDTLCNGKCTGDCTILVQGGMHCGADVRCKGQCEGAYTEPQCEAVFVKPRCLVEPSCIAACSAGVSANALCEAPAVDLLGDASVNPDISKLMTTVRANLPALIAGAGTRGKLLLDAALRLRVAGETLAKDKDKLSARSSACALAGANLAAEATAHMSAVVRGSAEVMVSSVATSRTAHD